MEGLCKVLVNPLGPVQLKEAFAVSLDPVRLIVLPEQSGLLLEALLPEGDVGLVSVKGPTLFEGQPSRVTVMFLYSPAGSLSMVIVPVAEEVIVAEILLPAGLVYWVT